MESNEPKIDGYYVCIEPPEGRSAGAGWKLDRIVKNEGPNPKNGKAPCVLWPYKSMNSSYAGIHPWAVRDATIGEIMTYETGNEQVVLLNNYEIF